MAACRCGLLPVEASKLKAEDDPPLFGQHRRWDAAHVFDLPYAAVADGVVLHVVDNRLHRLRSGRALILGPDNIHKDVVICAKVFADWRATIGRNTINASVATFVSSKKSNCTMRPSVRPARTNRFLTRSYIDGVMQIAPYAPPRRSAHACHRSLF